MKIFGYILIAAGFLAGALFCVVDLKEVNWYHYGAAIAAGVVGVALARLGHRRLAAAPHRLAADMEQVFSSLERIATSVRRLNTEKSTIHTCDMRLRIDERVADDLQSFVAARMCLATAHGLAVYASVMSHFAAGERYLNRVWSASADGYVDEVNAYLEKSQNEFDAALGLLLKARKQTA